MAGGIERLRINYNKKSDESAIAYKAVNVKPTRETISGKRFLQIYTDKSKMEYIIQ